MIVLFGRPGETFEAPPKGAHGDTTPAETVSRTLPADAVPA